MDLLYLGEVVDLATTAGSLCNNHDYKHLSFATCLCLPGSSAQPALPFFSCWREPQLLPDSTSPGDEKKKELACLPSDGQNLQWQTRGASLLPGSVFSQCFVERCLAPSPSVGHPVYSCKIPNTYTYGTFSFHEKWQICIVRKLDKY